MVIAIDAFSAGASSFMNFDLTMNMHDYLKFFDRLEATDYDVIVPGHHGTPATKRDVEFAKSYVTDIVNTMAQILEEDRKALVVGLINWKTSTFGLGAIAAPHSSMISGMLVLGDQSSISIVDAHRLMEEHRSGGKIVVLT